MTTINQLQSRSAPHLTSLESECVLPGSTWIGSTHRAQEISNHSNKQTLIHSSPYPPFLGSLSTLTGFAICSLAHIAVVLSQSPARYRMSH